MNDEFIKFLKIYQPNEILIREGSETDDFFCLVQGKVGIWKGDPTAPDDMVKIGELSEKGTYFGEMSCLIKEVRTASIIAMEEPVKVLKLPGEMLPQMILKQPSLALKLCTAMADRLRGTTTKQQDIAIQRNEIRDDATAQFLHARESYQKVFMMLTAIQRQMQNPNLKLAIEFMSRDKLMQGGKKIRFDETFLEDIPPQLIEPIRQAYNKLM